MTTVTIPCTLRLPLDLYKRIKADVGDRGFSREVRRRLVEWQEFHDAGYHVHSKTVSVIEKRDEFGLPEDFQPEV